MNIESAGGVNNTGTIDLYNNRFSVSTGQTRLDVVNAAAGFGVTSQVTGTVSLVADSLIEFASGGITQFDMGAVLALDGAKSRVAIAGTNTDDNTALSDLAENDGVFYVADGATVTTTAALDKTGTKGVDNSDGQNARY